MAVVGLGMFMALLDGTIVNIAIPAILDDLQTTITDISWVLNAYNIGLAALFLSFGRLADRFGHRLIFVLGLVLFSLFSLACGLAPNIGWLIGFRVGQSIGAAAMVPVSLTLLMEVFPRRQHGMATALWGVIGAIAAAVGPTLGGVLVEYGSWHWIFFVNVPIGVLALAGTYVFVPEHRADIGKVGVDLPGIVLSGMAFFALTLGLIQGNSWGWASGRVLGLIVGAAVLLCLFVLWQWRARSPMLNLLLFRIRSFSSSNASMFFIGAAVGGPLFLVVIFLVNVLGFSEIRAAIAVTPMPAMGFVIAPIVGKAINRTGPRPLAALGGVLFAVALFLLSRLDGSAGIGDVIWRLMFLGAAFACSMPTLTAAGMGSLPDASRGVGSGVINTSRQFGMVLGVAICVAIFTSTMSGAVQDAATEATAYVNSQSQIPAGIRDQIVTAIEKTAAENQGTAGRPSGSTDILRGKAQAPEGSPQADMQKQLGDRLSLIFKNQVAGAFRWPFLASAFCALLSIPFSLMTGRRLGDHLGHESRPA